MSFFTNNKYSDYLRNNQFWWRAEKSLWIKFIYDELFHDTYLTLP